MATLPLWQAADTQESYDDLTTEATFSVTKPTNLAEGDLILIFIGASAGLRTVTPATDFLLIQNSTADATSNFRPHNLAYWKIATSSEPASYTFERSDITSNNIRMTAGRVTNYRTVAATPIDQSNANNSGSTSGVSFAVNGLTPSEINTLFFASIAGTGNMTGNSLVIPSPLTEIFRQHSIPGFGGGEEDRTTTDATGTRTFEWLSNNRIAGLSFNIFGAESGEITDIPFLSQIIMVN